MAEDQADLIRVGEPEDGFGHGAIRPTRRRRTQKKERAGRRGGGRTRIERSRFAGRRDGSTGHGAVERTWDLGARGLNEGGPRWTEVRRAIVGRGAAGESAKAGPAGVGRTQGAGPNGRWEGNGRRRPRPAPVPSASPVEFARDDRGRPAEFPRRRGRIPDGMRKCVVRGRRRRAGGGRTRRPFLRAVLSDGTRALVDADDDREVVVHDRFARLDAGLPPLPPSERPETKTSPPRRSSTAPPRRLPSRLPRRLPPRRSRPRRRLPRRSQSLGTSPSPARAPGSTSPPPPRPCGSARRSPGAPAPRAPAPRAPAPRAPAPRVPAPRASPPSRRSTTVRTRRTAVTARRRRSRKRRASQHT